MNLVQFSIGVVSVSIPISIECVVETLLNVVAVVMKPSATSTSIGPAIAVESRTQFLYPELVVNYY